MEKLNRRNSQFKDTRSISMRKFTEFLTDLNSTWRSCLVYFQEGASDAEFYNNLYNSLSPYHTLCVNSREKISGDSHHAFYTNIFRQKDYLHRAFNYRRSNVGTLIRHIGDRKANLIIIDCIQTMRYPKPVLSEIIETFPKAKFIIISRRGRKKPLALFSRFSELFDLRANLFCQGPMTFQMKA